jgi:hypothetical protein
MKKLYELWYVQHNMDKPCRSMYVHVEFDEHKKTWSYRLSEVLDSFPRLSRSDVISINLEKLQNTCKYLNEMADEDIHYEIRSVEED